MRSVSVVDLTGDKRRRWAENRRELWRAVLRDPRASEGVKNRAREKLKTAEKQPL